MKKKRLLTDREPKTERFAFCDDLGCPEMVVIVDQHWCREHREQILGSPGVHSLNSDANVLVIPNSQDRLVFMLRFA